MSTARTEPQDAVRKKKSVKQHIGVEADTLRLVLDQEGVRADAAIGVPHVAHTDHATRAAAKGTGFYAALARGRQGRFERAMLDRR